MRAICPGSFSIVTESWVSISCFIDIGEVKILVDDADWRDVSRIRANEKPGTQ